MWVIFGGWGWVKVYGTLFWVGGCWQDIILGGGGWVKKYFGWVEVGGSDQGWVHYLIIPYLNFFDLLIVLLLFLIQSDLLIRPPI